MILFLKQVGEWIGYRWALRHDKNVVGVAGKYLLFAKSIIVTL